MLTATHSSEVTVPLVPRALRALVRLRLAEQTITRQSTPAVVRLTSQPAVVDPPREPATPIGDPPPERPVEIPLYLEP